MLASSKYAFQFQATIEEVTITLPSWMLTKKAGNSSARLRSIREQCEGVQLKHDSTNPRKLIISGPPQSIEKAKSLVDSILTNMPEGCTEVSRHRYLHCVFLPPFVDSQFSSP